MASSKSGGYGAVSKSYGMSPHSSYVDYEKIFSYLGKFRANGAYDSFEGRDSPGNGKTFSASAETRDNTVKHIKYFSAPGREFGRGEGADLTSLVPIAGMNSGEWEDFKLWFQLEKVAYALKRKIA